MDDEDNELLQRVLASQEGDLRAFEDLVRHYQNRIVADCRHITRDPNSAEDLAQDVFVKAFFGLRRFEGRSTFRQWLQRIKVNHCLNHLKKQEGRTLVGIDDDNVGESEHLSVAPMAHRNVELATERERIARILDEMSPTLRIPLVLCDMDELSYEEIAQTLHISLSATKMRIKRAREEFRARYEAATDLAAGEQRR